MHFWCVHKNIRIERKFCLTLSKLAQFSFLTTSSLFPSVSTDFPDVTCCSCICDWVFGSFTSFWKIDLQQLYYMKIIVEKQMCLHVISNYGLYTLPSRYFRIFLVHYRFSLFDRFALSFSYASLIALDPSEIVKVYIQKYLVILRSIRPHMLKIWRPWRFEIIQTVISERFLNIRFDLGIK